MEHHEEEKEPEAVEAEKEAGGQKEGKQHVGEIKVEIPPAEDGAKTADIDPAQVGRLVRKLKVK